MPFPNEHAARQTDPDIYDDFRRTHPKQWPAGLDAIWGLHDGGSELQSVRANSDEWTIAEFRKWLEDNDMKTAIEEAAPEAMAALTDDERTPPKTVQENAARALEVRAEKPESQRGMTDVGIARATQLKNGETLSEETIRRMKAYFDRHQGDKDGEAWSEQGKGWQAWMGWGGDEGWAWAKRLVEKMDKAEEMSAFMANIDGEKVSLEPSAFDAAPNSPLLIADTFENVDGLKSGDKWFRVLVPGPNAYRDTGEPRATVTLDDLNEMVRVHDKLKELGQHSVKIDWHHLSNPDIYLDVIRTPENMQPLGVVTEMKVIDDDRGPALCVKIDWNRRGQALMESSELPDGTSTLWPSAEFKLGPVHDKRTGEKIGDAFVRAIGVQGDQQQPDSMLDPLTAYAAANDGQSEFAWPPAPAIASVKESAEAFNADRENKVSEETMMAVWQRGADEFAAECGATREQYVAGAAMYAAANEGTAEMFRMRVMGSTCKEIGEKFGITKQAVSKRLQRSPFDVINIDSSENTVALYVRVCYSGARRLEKFVSILVGGDRHTNDIDLVPDWHMAFVSEDSTPPQSGNNTESGDSREDQGMDDFLKLVAPFGLSDDEMASLKAALEAVEGDDVDKYKRIVAEYINKALGAGSEDMAATEEMSAGGTEAMAADPTKLDAAVVQLAEAVAPGAGNELAEESEKLKYEELARELKWIKENLTRISESFSATEKSSGLTRADVEAIIKSNTAAVNTESKQAESFAAIETRVEAAEKRADAAALDALKVRGEAEADRRQIVPAQRDAFVIAFCAAHRKGADEDAKKVYEAFGAGTPAEEAARSGVAGGGATTVKSPAERMGDMYKTLKTGGQFGLRKAIVV